MRIKLSSALLLLMSILLLNSCKKENEKKGGYYIKGKMDGVAFTHSAFAMANIFDYGNGMTSVSLSANLKTNTEDLTSLGLLINFFNGNKPVAGTYLQDYTGTDYVAQGAYNPNSLTIVYGAGLYYPSAKPLRIIITSLTDTEVAGTFEGAFYKQDSSIPAWYNEYKLITEGEFRLPVKK